MAIKKEQPPDATASPVGGDTGGTPRRDAPNKPVISSRPVQVAGKYPVREVTYYQFNTSDIRSIGLAQAAATVLAAIGTFALSSALTQTNDSQRLPSVRIYGHGP